VTARRGPPKAHDHPLWDWSTHRLLWDPEPCIVCKKPALMTNCAGSACHKGCVPLP
jgi:hypothetical protein